MACRYSAAIHLCDGNDDQDACGDVLIACGTVFNHILLWAPFRMPDRLLCDYVGHEVCALTHSHTHQYAKTQRCQLYAVVCTVALYDRA
jgi:hypothetical protein